MRTRELLRLVWQNITQNKFKTIMTSIGIIVGAATIVMVIAIGKGGQEDVADQFKNLNAGAIDISYEGEGARKNFNGSSGDGMMPGGGRYQGGFSGEKNASGSKMPNQSAERGEFSGGAERSFERSEQGEKTDGAQFFGGGPNMEERINQEKVTLTDEDVEDITTFVSGISDATISYTTKSTVDGGNLEEETTYTIAGVKANYVSMSNLKMALGEFITDANEENKEKICILGAKTAEEIFGNAIDAYGSILYIDNRMYVVNGVLAEMGAVASGISPDDAVFIPYAAGIKYLVGENVNPAVTVIAEDVANIDTVIADVTEVLANSYPNTEFTFTDAGSKMEAASESNEILTVLLIAMAVIVFVVGGIGIMNVLFVSVKERTNEIGILKALGCSQKNILFEFLLEASAISMIGGILGVFASLLVTPVVEQFGIRVELSFLAFITALVFAVGTGTLFGFYPAYKASKLVPVEALSAE